MLAQWLMLARSLNNDDNNNKNNNNIIKAAGIICLPWAGHYQVGRHCTGEGLEAR